MSYVPLLKGKYYDASNNVILFITFLHFFQEQTLCSALHIYTHTQFLKHTGKTHHVINSIINNCVQMNTCQQYCVWILLLNLNHFTLKMPYFRIILLYP